MHKKLKRFLFVLPAVVLFSFCLNASAAGGNTTLYNGNGTNVSGQTGSVFNPNHGLVIANPLASIIGNPNSPAPLVLESCRNYSGFINKIVKCITNFTSRAEVYQKLNALNGKFAGAANAVLIIYIMLFGLRLSMNVVDNVRGELVIAIMTCFFITYCNNAYRIDSFMRFFVGFQNEFANVAFVALGDTAHNGANSEKADCIISSQDPSGTRVLNLWERMDCVLATILGAQPLIELKGQYFDPNGQGNAADPASVTQLTNSNSNIVHQMLTDNGTLFPDLTKGPFCFFRYPSDLTSTNVSSIITNTSAVTSDACLTSLDLNDLDSIARPVKSDRYESYITFSFIVILVGALSQDPSIGLTIFLTGFFVAILVLAAFGQAVFVYITSLFAIMALGLFAPLILPCVLFKPTQGIFNQWVQMLFAYSLQPGILICYLSFMIFVLQFVLEYKHIGSRDPNVQCTSEDSASPSYMNGPTCCTKTDPKDDYYRFNPECKGAVPSFKEFVNLMFQNGNFSYEEKAKITTQNTTQQDPNNYRQNLINSAATTREGAELGDMEWSLMGRGDASFSTLGTEDTTELRQEMLEKGFQIRNSGTNVQSIAIPSFSFTGSFNSIFNQFLNYDTTNSNMEGSLFNAQKNYSTDPTTGVLVTTGNNKPLDEAVKNAAAAEKANFKFTIGFMQSLMIIFVSLMITFTFMGNVLDLGGKLAGVNATSNMINVYNISASKMSKFLKS